MSWMYGYRKWSIAVMGILAALIAAVMGKLTAELAALIGTIVSGFLAANGYTTGKGNEATPTTGSTPQE